MPKVTILHTLPAIRSGGVSRLLLRLIQNLNKDSFKNIVCVFLDGDESLKKQFQSLGVEIIQLKYKGILSLPSVSHKVRRLAQERDVNIIHNHLWLDRIITGLASAFLNVKVVTTLHTTDNPYIRFGLIKFTKAFMEDMISKFSSDKFIAVTSVVKMECSKYRHVPVNQVEVIYSGVSKDFFDSAANRELREIGTLITVGRLTKLKGFDLILRAFKDLKQVYRELNLVIVGSGDEWDHLNGIVRSENIADVQFTGARNDIPYLLAQADMYISASLQEGFGLALCEAMAAGLPVVCSDIDVHKELVVDGVNGLVFKQNNVESLKESVVKILDSEELHRKLSKSGYQIARDRFNIENSARRYEDMYLKLVTH